MACISYDTLKASISGFYFSQEDSAILYRLLIEANQNVSWTIEKRYSDFEALHKNLVDSIGLSVKLPPKKLIRNKDPEFIEKRRENLNSYIRSVLGLLGKNPPVILANFLNLGEYEILFLLRKLAVDIFENGENILKSGEIYTINPYQIYSINERMKLAHPPLDSSDKRHDFSHILDFCCKIQNLEIKGCDTPIHKSNIIPNNYLMDLSPFKDIIKLTLSEIQVNKIKKINTLRRTTESLNVYQCSLDSTSSVLLSDSLYKDFSDTGIDFSWPNLKYLNISKNNINSIKDLDKIAPNLKLLNLSFNSISLPYDLSQLSHLEDVSYSSNSISDLSNLESYFHCIRSLDLSCNQVKKLSHLSKISSLIHLNLSCNKVDDIQEIKYLARLNLLKDLCLTGNPVAISIDYRVKALSYFGSRASQIVLDNEKASFTETDQISIVQALEISSIKK